MERGMPNLKGYHGKPPETAEQIAEIHWKQYTFACQISVASVFFQAGMFGACCELSHLLVSNYSGECPFEDVSECPM